MNCNCVKTTEKKLAEMPSLQAKAGANATAECTATGFAIDDDMGLRMTINIPFRVRGSGKGYTGANGKIMPFVSGYCPFCGRTTGRYVVGEYDGIPTV